MTKETKTEPTAPASAPAMAKKPAPASAPAEQQLTREQLEAMGLDPAVYGYV